MSLGHVPNFFDSLSARTAWLRINKWRKLLLDRFQRRGERKEAREDWHFLKKVIVRPQGQMCQLGEDGRVKNNLAKTVAFGTRWKQKEREIHVV